MRDAPELFRVVLEVKGIEKAAAAYATLLGVKGRPVGGGRVYFQCGPVILALLDPARKPRPSGQETYFAVRDVERVHARARKLGWLSDVDVHGESGAEVHERPWGERSFYAEDPWGNGLCFVEEGTRFTGR